MHLEAALTEAMKANDDNAVTLNSIMAPPNAEKMACMSCRTAEAACAVVMP